MRRGWGKLEPNSYSDEQNKSALKPGESPVLFIHDKTMERPKNTKEYIEPFRKNIPKTELED